MGCGYSRSSYDPRNPDNDWTGYTWEERQEYLRKWDETVAKRKAIEKKQLDEALPKVMSALGAVLFVSVIIVYGVGWLISV